MSNDYFNETGDPIAESRGISSIIRNVVILIRQGFDKLPSLASLYSNSQNYVVDTGIANAVVVAMNAAITVLPDGLEVRIKILNANTGATTINVNLIGAVSATHPDGTQLVANELLAGQIATFNYSLAQNRFQYAQSLTAPVTGGLPLTGGTMLGQINEAKAASVASSTATSDIWSGTGNTMHITGTTTMTGLPAAPQAGTWRRLYFDSTVLLTNSSNFNVQGGANYTTEAGDIVLVYADTTTKFYLSILKSNGTSFALPYLHVREQQTSSTNGGTSVAIDITQSRVLNTVVVNTITGASLASNTVTLPAGTYQCRIRVPGADAINQTKAFLYNTSDSAYTLIGSNGSSAVSNAYDSFIAGQFTIAASKNFKIRHWTTSAQSNTGLGTNAGTGQVEIFTEAEFWKVA